MTDKTKDKPKYTHKVDLHGCHICWTADGKFACVMNGSVALESFEPLATEKKSTAVDRAIKFCRDRKNKGGK